jgi:hypothetical protein
MSTGISTGSLVAWMLSMAVLCATNFCRCPLFLYNPDLLKKFRIEISEKPEYRYRC